jgi:protein-S-isoprenylcysteine O-methyltransferase Ste14
MAADGLMSNERRPAVGSVDHRAGREETMSSRKTLQEILGYLIGGSIVLVLLPYGLIRASARLAPLIPVSLIPLPALRIAVAVVLLALGLSFGIWSIIVQNVEGKGGPVQIGNLDISPKTQNLVVTGPYRYSRNPMLFGACLAYYALAVYLNSIIALGLVTLFMIFMLIFVKLSEEPRLLKDFGAEYEAYRQKVSIFIPWPRK